MMDGKFPATLSHYRILRKLGQGGMSIVYEALDERLKRPVALKILHPYLAEAKEYRSRFFREAEAVARLTHPNILQIFDVASPDAFRSQLFIVTELIKGPTLKAYVERSSLFDLPELSSLIIKDIAHALDHAHQKGIVHRDLKPENIMISDQGQIKLMDFGIATIGNEESLTQAGALVGSLAHLAPEIIKGKKATVSSDIFSLTTIFYWLLTKEWPFKGDSPHALLKAIVDDPHKKVQGLSPFITDDIADIVDKGLNKDQKSRFRSALEMAEALETALMRMGINVDDKTLKKGLLEYETNFTSFRALIIGQIEKQRDLYRKALDETRALSLTCRLEADVNLNSRASTRNRRYYGGALAIFTCLIVSILWMLWPHTKMEPKQWPVEANVSDAIEPLPVEEIEIVETKPDEPVFEIKEIKEVSVMAPREIQQEIELVIWPFANVSVNGNLVARDTKNLKLKLGRGKHKLLFTHTYAATVEKIIEIEKLTDMIEIQIALVRSKPAFLTVKSNIDADVAIDGSYKGSAKNSLTKPIVVPIADKTHSAVKEVIISEEGYRPNILEVEFIAGQTKSIEVMLDRVE